MSAVVALAALGQDVCSGAPAGSSGATVKYGIIFDAGSSGSRIHVYSWKVAKSNRSQKPALHPCIPKGASVEHNGVELSGDGDWTKCLKLTSKLFAAPEWSIADMPPLPASFYGFSYMYDRTAAIGLLDSNPQQFGSAPMSIAMITEAGTKACALDAAETKTRFASTQDAAKANNYCGDVAYIAALLQALGFGPTTPLTMTNKIKDVELVWTLGAMLAKSAELAAAGSGVSWTRRLVQIIGAWLLLVLIFRCFKAKTSPRSRGSIPL